MAGAFAALLGLGACDGDNLFDDGARGGEGPPVIESVLVPLDVQPGSTLDVKVRARAPAGLQRVDVRFRGAVEADRSSPFDGSRTDTVTAELSVNVPATVEGTVITVEVTATDKLGRTGAPVTATVNIASSGLPSGSRESLAPLFLHLAVNGPADGSPAACEGRRSLFTENGRRCSKDPEILS